MYIAYPALTSWPADITKLYPVYCMQIDEEL